MISKSTLPSQVRSAVEAAYRYYSIGQLEWEIEQVCLRLVNLNPSVIVEIGAYRGGMAYVLSHLAATVISVDIDHNGFLHDLKRDSILHVTGNSTLETTIEQAKAHLGGRPIDFLFIDGDHTPEGVTSDWRLWSPLVRPGGLVGFHDSANDACRGVRSLFDSLPGEKEYLIQTPELCRAGWAGQVGCGGIGLIKI